MDVKQLQRLFSPELRALLTGGKETESENKFAENLLKAKNSEKVLKLYCKEIKGNVKRLEKQPETEKEKKWAKKDKKTLARLVEKFSDTYKATPPEISDKAHETAAKIAALRISSKKKKDKDAQYVFIEGVKVREEKIIPADFVFDTFAEGKCKLSELAEKLKKPEEIKALHNKVVTSAHRFIHQHKNPRSKELQKLNATQAKFGKRQNYFMLGAPKSESRAKEFYDVVLKENIRLLVSVNETGEGKRPPFWKNSVVKKLKLEEGFSLFEDKNRKTVLAKAVDEKTGKVLQVVERIIIAKRDGKTRILFHLHYEGWIDGKPCPNEKLLNKLLARIKELQQNDTPFSTNCQHGVGRTGIITVTNYCWHHIDKQLAEGVHIDDVTINIPEIVYEFRKHRSSMVGRSEQFLQVYSLVAAYYGERKAQSAAREI